MIQILLDQVRYGVVPINRHFLPLRYSQINVLERNVALVAMTQSVQGSHVTFSQSNQVLSVLIGEPKGWSGRTCTLYRARSLTA